MNGILYASGRLINGIYILDMSNQILNVNDNKRPKGDNMKSSYFWHCRLDHVSKKHMMTYSSMVSWGHLTHGNHAC